MQESLRSTLPIILIVAVLCLTNSECALVARALRAMHRLVAGQFSRPPWLQLILIKVLKIGDGGPGEGGRNF